MNSYLTDVPSDKIVMMTKYNIDPTTYRQSSSAGTVAFSITNFWKSSESFYLLDIYNNNSLLYPIVEEYVSYLNESLIEDARGSLLTYSQAENLGCSGYSCSSAPRWVYSTNYWLGSAYGTSTVFGLNSDGGFYGEPYNYHNGVRPVITISTSDIQQ